MEADEGVMLFPPGRKKNQDIGDRNKGQKDAYINTDINRNIYIYPSHIIGMISKAESKKSIGYPAEILV